MASSGSPTGAVYAYRAFLASSAAVAVVAVVFFVIGLGDGSVSSFNMGIWALLLTVVAAVLWAGCALRARGRTGLATLVLALTAVPGFVGGLLLLLLLVAQPRWN